MRRERTRNEEADSTSWQSILREQISQPLRRIHEWFWWRARCLRSRLPLENKSEIRISFVSPVDSDYHILQSVFCLFYSAKKYHKWFPKSSAPEIIIQFVIMKLSTHLDSFWLSCWKTLSYLSRSYFLIFSALYYFPFIRVPDIKVISHQWRNVAYRKKGVLLSKNGIWVEKDG